MQNQAFGHYKLNKELFVVVPAYNEEKTVAKVVTELCEMGYMVVVVDDGSHDKTYSIVKDLQEKYPKQISIYSHTINRGLGAALKTGLEASLRKGAKYMVTFDADCQHDPYDIDNVCEPLKLDEADVVLGDRNFDDMPLSKKISNQIMNFITLLFYGVKVKDSQSGLRAFNSKTTQLLELQSRGYGVSSEIVREIKKNHLRLKEVPIKTIYTPYSISKGTNATIGIKILFKMIIDILKKF
ncbi:MAG: glycosyltransferase family 2 protein [Methanobacteriales archaeon HGW-Methanobacteriales-1]|jgi:glycosyltransferase involved in cell wall biosynthesis|nr:MAG: glycosyltransferase family 2 protein [Methanobacteriales archaeon HGW-Methanobacteriales-1]